MNESLEPPTQTELRETKGQSRLSLVAFVAVAGTCLFCYLYFQERDNKKQTALKLDEEITHSTKLYNLLGKANKKVDSLTTLVRSGQASYAQKEQEIKNALADRNAINDKLTATQRKVFTLETAFRNGDITAQRLRDSLSSMPVFSDDEANRIYLKLTDERDAWRDSASVAFEQVGQEQQRNRTLSDRLTQIGKLAANNRQTAQDERDKASSNFPKRIVNSGRIKVLKRESEDWKKVQELASDKEESDLELDLNRPK